MAFNTYPETGKMNGFVDPELGYYETSPYSQGYNNNTPQIQRYLQEPKSAGFGSSHTWATSSVHLATPHVDSYLPFHHDSQGQSDSHISHSHSPVLSGGQSPLTESDLYPASTQGPPTPPDAAAMSPYFQHSLYEWDNSASQNSPTGLASVGVNLSQINPGLDPMLDGFDKEDGPSFTLTPDHELPFAGGAPSQYPDIISFEDQNIMPDPHGAGPVPTEPSSRPMYPDPESISMDLGQGEGATPTVPSNNKRPGRSSAKRGGTGARRGRPKKNMASALAQTAGVSKSNSDGKRSMAGTIVVARKCDHCPELSFKNDTDLKKHEKDKHRRYYICVFNFAGCTQSFKSKNEWKRHVASQHLCLKYWVCSNGECSQARAVPYLASNTPSMGKPFRRKDLFTQHFRRMHQQAPVEEAGNGSKAGPMTVEDEIKSHQDLAERQRCKLPTHMRCPARHCGYESTSDMAWDNYMEHVAGHLERAGRLEEAPFHFGGPGDETLTNWAASNTVQVIHPTEEGWKLSEPLGAKPPGKGKNDESADEDAEGEDC